MGSIILLDTHVLLYLLKDPGLIKKDALDEIADASNSVLVSAISAFEIAQKVRVGKLEAPGVLESWSEVLGRNFVVEVPLDGGVLIAAGTIPWIHRDPFDRMIVAQAQRSSAILATRDQTILEAELVPVLEA